MLQCRESPTPPPKLNMKLKIHWKMITIYSNNRCIFLQCGEGIPKETTPQERVPHISSQKLAQAFEGRTEHRPPPAHCVSSWILLSSPYSFVLKRGVTLVVSNSGKRNWAYVASSLWPSIFITGSSINHQNTACVSSFWSARPPRWYILVCERSMVWGDAKSTISHLDASCYILPSSYYW